jgi:hypothetical protein
LAAQYFAPFLFGTSYPSSLQDAWGAIDQSILLFVFGKTAQTLTAPDVALYKLVGDEASAASRSTISDWHIKGIEQLDALIQECEQHLQVDLSFITAVPASVPEDRPATNPLRLKKLLRRAAVLVALILLVVLLVAGVKGWRVYHLVRAIQTDVSHLQGLASVAPLTSQIGQAGPALDKLHLDVSLLSEEIADPLRVMGPWLAWLPGYGPDLAAASDMLELADKMTASAQIIFQTSYPLYQQFQSAHLTTPELIKSLLKAQPQYLLAQNELADAQAIRARLEVSRLSPRLQTLMEQIDRGLGLLDDGLSIVLTVPKILGASSDGPKTYMLLVQNEDELRPTGGFIGVVGSFVLRDGLPMSIAFKDSYSFDDWTKPYPEPPWQLEQYMKIPALVLRDANWYTSFPSAASWIEYLYAYVDNHSVDGVIAIDQQSLVYLLQAIGPITVNGAAQPISTDNVIEFMRKAKIPPPTEKDPNKWYLEHRKDFIAPLANAIIARLLSGKDISWQKLAESLLRALNERDILLQFDDPLITHLISKYEWDGALKPGSGDFIMVVDSNVGFNKANAMVETKLVYSADLTDLRNPVSSLVIFHTNNSTSTATCSKFDSGDMLSSPFYAMDRCYWDYLRVYVPKGARLAGATPHFIPAVGSFFGKDVPARVDTLDMEYEEIDNLTGFGTLLAVPGKDTLSTSFKFLLPSSVVAWPADNMPKTYSLRIEKQPGSRPAAVTIRVHLPNNARINSLPAGASVQGSDILIETTLITDIKIQITFNTP